MCSRALPDVKRWRAALHYSPANLKMHVATLKFLYGVTRDRPDVVARIPYPKVPRTLLDIPRPGEVAKVLAAVRSPKHRVLLFILRCLSLIECRGRRGRARHGGRTSPRLRARTVRLIGPATWRTRRVVGGVIMKVPRRLPSLMLAGMVCSVLAAATLLPGAADGGTVPCSATFPQCNGACPANSECVGLGGGACICFETGCCQVDSQTCNNGAFQALCSGQWVSGGTCGVDCMPQTPASTPTATHTPTATATDTKVPNGGGCEDPVDCVSGNCVDDTCCTDPSCPPGQSCDNPGNVGLCSADPVAPAPALSPGAGVLAVTLLIAIAAIALLRWRRTNPSC